MENRRILYKSCTIVFLKTLLKAKMVLMDSPGKSCVEVVVNDENSYKQLPSVIIFSIKINVQN